MLLFLSTDPYYMKDSLILVIIVLYGFQVHNIILATLSLFFRQLFKMVEFNKVHDDNLKKIFSKQYPSSWWRI